MIRILWTECPGIYFADEPSGRTAKIMGTGVGVWEVVRDDLAVEQQDDRLREIFPFLTRAQIAAARNYALRFRDEIDQRITAASLSRRRRGCVGAPGRASSIPRR